MQRTMAARRLSFGAFGILWLVALGAGLMGLYQRLISGHELAAYTRSVPWGLWVAAYAYLIGMSAGIFLVLAFDTVFGFGRLARFTRLGLFAALVLLASGLLTILLDLGHMTRMYRMYTSMNPSSMMAWLVLAYTAYGLLLAASVWFSLRAALAERAAAPGFGGRLAALLTLGRRDTSALAVDSDRRAVRVLMMLGIPLLIAGIGGSGSLFGVVGARHFWNASLMPILFITGALTSGAALLTVLAALFGPECGSAGHRNSVRLLGRVLLALLGIYIAVLWAEYSISLYADVPAASDPVDQILNGPFPWVFWVFQVALGAVVPIALLSLGPRSVPAVTAAAALVAMSFLATRLNIVIPGQVEPQLEGLEAAYRDARLAFDYVPSLMEWLVLAFIGALASGLFFLGMLGLPLTNGRKEVSS